MKFKKAKTAFEIEEALKTGDAYLDQPIEAALTHRVAEYREKGLLLTTYGIADIGLDKADVGLQGSPTWVKKVENVVLAGGARKKIEPTLSEINALVHELIEDHTLG
jgi:electron transfer flavoprotein beta subunit